MIPIPYFNKNSLKGFMIARSTVFRVLHLLYNAFILLTILIPSTIITPGFAQQDKILELTPTDDAYVVSDLNDPIDKLGLRTLNTGNFKFLKVWYAWNVTGAETMKIVSLAYLKFDLSDVTQDRVSSAKLKMYALNMTLTGVSRFIDVHVGSMSPWRESTLTYPDAPSFPADPFATTSISLPSWYEWDVTDAVKEKAGSDLTLVMLMKRLINNTEEQVVFASKDTDDRSLMPRLVIETTAEASTSVSSSGDVMPILAAGIAAGAGGGAAGFMVYRRRNQQRSTLQISSDAPKETSPELCPNCGKKISKDFSVCPFCEHDLRQIKCAACGKDISKDYRVCPYCGTKINL